MRRSRLLALFAALALIFAACGDDDDGDATTDETTTTVEEPDATDDGEDTTTTTEAEEDDEEAAGGTGGMGDVDLGECGFFVDFAETFDELDVEAMFGEGEGDFGDLIASMAVGLDGVADAAPSDIRDEFRTMADGFTEAAKHLEGVALDFSDPMNMDPAVMEAFESAGAIFEHPEFIAAGDAISTWMEDACPDLAPEGGFGIG